MKQEREAPGKFRGSQALVLHSGLKQVCHRMGLKGPDSGKSENGLRTFSRVGETAPWGVFN